MLNRITMNENLNVSPHGSNTMLAAALSDVGKFMGKKFKDPMNYMYDKDWNWLMKACKKFDRLNLLDKEYELLCDEIDNAVSCYELKPAFKNLVKAIRWYNNNYAVSKR